MQKVEDPGLFILNLLKNKGGSYNLYHVESRLFNDPHDPGKTMSFLASNDLIREIPGGVGQTYSITEKGEKHLYNLYLKSVLHHLAKDNIGFTTISAILTNLSISDPGGKLAAEIKDILVRKKLVFSTEDSENILITSVGREFLEEEKYGISQKIPSTQITNSGVFIHGSSVDKSSIKNSVQNSAHSQEKKRRIIGIAEKVIIGVLIGLIIAYFVYKLGWN